MADLPSLAVVICTYNRPKLCRAAAESALASIRADPKGRPCEVIVVDDGGPPEIFAEIGSLPGVRYIRQENQGLSGALNTGIRSTDAEDVAFLDDDDEFLPGKVARDRDVIEAEPGIDFLYSNAQRVSPSGEDLGLCLVNHRQPARPLEALLRENFVLVQTVVARRQVLIDAGFFDRSGPLTNDVDLWVRVAARTDRFRFAPEPLVRILRHPNAMSADPIRMQEALLAVGERHRELIRGALGNPPRDWWLAGPHYRLGRTWYERGEWEKARFHLSASLRADPTHRQARLYSAMARFGAVGQWPFRQARAAKRAVWQRLARLGWVETRW